MSAELVLAIAVVLWLYALYSIQYRIRHHEHPRPKREVRLEACGEACAPPRKRPVFVPYGVYGPWWEPEEYEEWARTGAWPEPSADPVARYERGGNE
jgi:hypothetical protein